MQPKKKPHPPARKSLKKGASKEMPVQMKKGMHGKGGAQPEELGAEPKARKHGAMKKKGNLGGHKGY